MATLLRIPDIETPRLVVREIVEQDWKPFSRYMTRPDYQRWIAARLGGTPEVRSFVRSALARQGWPHRRSFHLAAVAKGEERVVGDGFILIARNGIAEVGWGVAPTHWGRGIGGDIARVLVALAIERIGAPKVWCKVMSPNLASLKVAAKAGFERQKTLGAYQTGKGGSVDVHVLALDRRRYFEAAY